jgi:hypothetical protein
MSMIRRAHLRHHHRHDLRPDVAGRLGTRVRWRGLSLALAILLVAAPVSASSELPTLREAFGHAVAGVDNLLRGDGLLRIDIPITHYPDALCADGTPVPIYVRRASDGEHQDDWIVYLQGGGTCDSGQNCFERWKGRDGNFGANKLSSQFAPAGGIEARGIHLDEPRNPFAGWNHVFVYYCSSDGWSGQVRDREAQARVGDESVEIDYRLHFLGARIVDAVFDMLRGGAGALRYRNASGAEVELPRMSRDGTVLFAGSSAGGGGVIRNADRIHDTFRVIPKSCHAGTCAPRFLALIDGSVGLAREELDHGDSRTCGEVPAGTCTYGESMRLRWEIVTGDFWGGLSDSSCIAHQTERGESWRCADGVHIVRHHLTTPFFVRTDLQDSLVLRNTLDAGYGYQGVPLDRELYGDLLELQLLRLASGKGRTEPQSHSIGMFAPQCGTHVGLTSNPASYRHSIDTAHGSLTFLQTLANWVDGAGPVVAIQAFEPGGAPAGCTAAP